MSFEAFEDVKEHSIEELCSDFCHEIELTLGTYIRDLNKLLGRYKRDGVVQVDYLTAVSYGEGELNGLIQAAMLADPLAHEKVLITVVPIVERGRILTSFMTDELHKELWKV